MSFDIGKGSGWNRGGGCLWKTKKTFSKDTVLFPLVISPHNFRLLQGSLCPKSLLQMRLLQLKSLCTLSEITAHSAVYLHLNELWAVYIQLDCSLRCWYTVEWAISSESASWAIRYCECSILTLLGDITLNFRTVSFDLTPPWCDVFSSASVLNLARGVTSNDLEIIEDQKTAWCHTNYLFILQKI